MRRTELKEILQKNTEESRWYYHRYPCLYRDLMLWEYYLQCVSIRRKQKIHAPKNRARLDVCDDYAISEKTFYAIRRTLCELCEDV